MEMWFNSFCLISAIVRDYVYYYLQLKEQSWQFVFVIFVTTVLNDSGPKGAFSKMCLDQSLFAPCFIVVFVSAASTLNGLSSQVRSSKIIQILGINISSKYADILNKWKWF